MTLDYYKKIFIDIYRGTYILNVYYFNDNDTKMNAYVIYAINTKRQIKYLC